MMLAEVWAQLEQDASLADGAARKQAIDPRGSFIVQAPAGSGKTALLTQRFLALLLTVDAPEQVVAMTFTKKAAAEMRERVLSALKQHDAQVDAEDVFKANTQRLAQAVMLQDNKHGWGLLQNPNRLRVRTIDSMNGYLVQNMPFLSRMGVQPMLADDNDALYLQAVRETLRTEQAQQPAAELLRLLNGRYARAEQLLVGMLRRRDQWMRLLWREDERASLEQALAVLVQTELQAAVQAVEYLAPLFAEMPSLAAYAKQHGAENLNVLAAASWPWSVELDSIEIWRQLANMVLTGKGDSIRKTVTKNNGFPSGKGEAKSYKDKMVELLTELAERADDRALAALAALKDLPQACYSDDQWQALQQVVTLLRFAVANLKWVFQTQAKTDFIEIAQAAELALGQENAPTELALQLDYQIQHLLIDEFQDTSVAQFELLKKLLRGWQPGDGRTVFIVGDPMQSIYRFREAEVGNFLQAWQGEGLDVGLQRINLQVNFRSSEPLVAWFNRTFAKVFPAQNDLVLGAVKYEQASALSGRPGLGEQSVLCHWALNQGAQQAQSMVAVIEKRLPQLAEGESVAVLGRSRSHLAQLAYQLKEHNIAFRAVELESLGERQEIQDALALSLALRHAEDRAAWLALLRCPFVGLSLADLYALCGQDKTRLYAPMPALMAQALPVEMSDEGRQRLDQAWSVLQPTLQNVGRMPFSRVVHQAWLQLGAAASLQSDVERGNIEVFFRGLAQFDDQGFEPQALVDWVSKLYAEGDSRPEAGRVQLMTMHKSKGLQFDTVLLPSLGQRPRGDEKSLISWLEFSSDQGEGLVLAPLDQKGGETSGLNRLIAKVECEKQAFEDARLLYVAATRAKSQLHLFASVDYSLKQHQEDAPLKPAANSLLTPLWSEVVKEFEIMREFEAKRLMALEQAETSLPMAKVSRLALSNFDLQTFAGQRVFAQGESKLEAAPSESPNPSPVSEVPRLVGILVHGVLETIAKQGSELWGFARVSQLKPHYQAWLVAQGLSEQDVAVAIARVMRSLQNALSNVQVMWSLSAGLSDAASELRLTSQFEKIENHVVDRTFVDQGVRWIIDYKTGACHQADVEGFIKQQMALYQPQLDRYGELFKRLESLPQRKVLYFTELDRWVELS